MCSKMGPELLQKLRSGGVDYCRPLSGPLPGSLGTVPSELQKCREALSSDVCEGLARIVTEPLSAPDERWLPFISGPTDARFGLTTTVEEYFIGLFNHIAAHSTASLSTCDLFHAHIMVDCSAEGAPDLVLLFHAREFPKEFTMSSTRIHPIGSEEIGGPRKDPRQGSSVSIFQPDFAERNFLWLLSTNTVYLLLPHHPAFPPTLLSPYAALHFATVSEAAFSHHHVADLNYFVTDSRAAETATGSTSTAATACVATASSCMHDMSLSVYAPYAARMYLLIGANQKAAKQPRLVDHAPVPDLVRASKAVIPAAAEMSAEVCMVAEHRRQQVDATIRYERLLRAHTQCVPPRMPCGGGMWVVLIGGEWGGCMQPDAKGTRPGKWLGSHTSLEAIGRAYEALMPSVGRERVIVIAQLRETLSWLEAATESEEACERVTGSARFLPTLRQRLADTQRQCALLIAHGGADYDYEDVNAATVLRVLQGEKEALDGRAAVPSSATCVLVLINSHGDCHPRQKDKPGVGLDEHYVHLPHPVPEGQEVLYEAVAWNGDPNVDTNTPFGPKKFRWRLYGTQLFQSLLSTFRQSPNRQVVLLNQSCLSAGTARFLFHPPFVTHFKTHEWPVLHVSTAGPWEASIGDFWDAFLSEWCHALMRPMQRITLGNVFHAAEQRYYAQNHTLKKHNEAVQDALVPPHTPLSFGTVQLHEGCAIDGRPMSETPVWELVCAEAAETKDVSAAAHTAPHIRAP